MSPLLPEPVRTMPEAKRVTFGGDRPRVSADVTLNRTHDLRHLDEPVAVSGYAGTFLIHELREGYSARLGYRITVRGPRLTSAGKPAARLTDSAWWECAEDVPEALRDRLVGPEAILDRLQQWFVHELADARRELTTTTTATTEP